MIRNGRAVLVQWEDYLAGVRKSPNALPVAQARRDRVLALLELAALRMVESARRRRLPVLRMPDRAA